MVLKSSSFAGSSDNLLYKVELRLLEYKISSLILLISSIFYSKKDGGVG
jgi:hypothetical protein